MTSFPQSQNLKGIMGKRVGHEQKAISEKRFADAEQFDQSVDILEK